MNNNKIIQLREEFPALFNDVYIGINDGWFDLLYELARDIQYICEDKDIEVPDVIQIKEKFGTLRFYINSMDEDINKVISIAERKSSKICENCGKKGEQRTGGWIKTLCDKCNNERNKR